MKRKGFTLVELLVVIAIIALLMGILMPALARVRQIAYRMICGTNLAGIGKAMLIYSNDNDEDYPKAGLSRSRWASTGQIADWDAQDGSHYGTAVTERVTITSSFFLLVKYADMTPKQFVCNGDAGTKAFKLSEATGALTNIDDITDVWDFGDSDGGTNLIPGEYCSYSYHMPYRQTAAADAPAYPITAVSNPGSPVCADRNPYLNKNATKSYLDGVLDPDEDPPEWATTPEPAHYSDPDKTGNAAAHQRDGQNVLFNDQHVSFEKWPNCGISNDNIWKCWTSATLPTIQLKELGASPYTALTDDGIGTPQHRDDAYLVGEKNGALQ